jgi:hypothetical protein
MDGNFLAVHQHRENAHQDIKLTHGEFFIDITGIGAMACGWHGCFCPGAVVDFQKGERYVLSVPLSISQSLF